MMKNTIVWFEIPVTNFDRAKKFYEELLGLELQVDEMGGAMMGFFPLEGEGVTGAIVKGEGYEPADKGTSVYFNCENDLQPVQDRIEPAGGKVIVPKTLIMEDIGYFCLFLDTEGNKVALWSKK
ncbi:MAG TPA: VOC family protein [Candidatus Cloacimonetes bacterium]|nr:VOC family protein [Candidatus Cloacimonadota bacterium]